MYAEPLVHYYRAGSALSRAGAVGICSGSRGATRRFSFITGITPALSEGCLALVRTMMSDARANAIEVWFDPNYRRKLWSQEHARETLTELLPQVDCVLAGLAEGELLTGETKPDLIARALRNRGPAQVAIKAGEQGAYGLSGPRSVSSRPWISASSLIPSAPVMDLRQGISPPGSNSGRSRNACNAAMVSARWCARQTAIGKDSLHSPNSMSS